MDGTQCSRLLSHDKKHPLPTSHNQLCLSPGTPSCCFCPARSETGIFYVQVLSAKRAGSCSRRTAASTGRQLKVGKAAQSIHNSPRVLPKYPCRARRTVSLPVWAGVFVTVQPAFSPRPTSSITRCSRETEVSVRGGPAWRRCLTVDSSGVDWSFVVAVFPASVMERIRVKGSENHTRSAVKQCERAVV